MGLKGGGVGLKGGGVGLKGGGVGLKGGGVGLKGGGVGLKGGGVQLKGGGSGKQERTSGVVGDPRRERKPWHKADAEGRGDRGTLPKAPWQDEGKKKETAQEAGKEGSGHKKEKFFWGPLL